MGVERARVWLYGDAKCRCEAFASVDDVSAPEVGSELVVRRGVRLTEMAWRRDRRGSVSAMACASVLADQWSLSYTVVALTSRTSV